MAFRDAHEVIGNIVLHCEKNNKAIADLPVSELKEFSPVFDDDVYDSISLEACVNNRNITGAPAPKRVLAHINYAKEFLKEI